MSVPIAKPLLLWSCLALGLGCASTRLILEVDLYSEDPSEIERLSLREAGMIQTSLDGMEISARQLTEDRIGLARDQFEVFKAAQALVRIDDLGTLPAQLARYEQDAKAPLVELDAAIRLARQRVEEYLAAHLDRSSGPDPPDEQARSEEAARLRHLEALTLVATDAAASAFRRLAGPLPNEFDLGAHWARVEAMLEPSNLAGVRAAYLGEPLAEFETRGEELGEAAAKLADRVDALGASRKERARQAAASIQRATGQDSFARLARSAMRRAINQPALEASPSGWNDLARLVKTATKVMSQIDRLQDAGDPVWRIVSDPSNSDKWNTEFSRTYFYAQGNSGVVVVRDNPMTYRVQRGFNNPAALVKGQLEVSRAVADAAITIAGAAAGVPPGVLPRMPAGSPENGQVEEPQPGAAEAAATLARRKARADQAMRIRQQKLRNLDHNLRNIETNLIEDRTAASTRRQLERLQRLLRSHASGFAPGAPPP